jgi:hypothetical protein
MTILTDDPDWKPDVYKARALAVMFVGKYEHAVPGGRQAIGHGLTVRYQSDGSSVRLTIDAKNDRVLSVKWKRSDACAWKSKPIAKANGNPGSRRQRIRAHGLNAAEQW